ncbi:MAG: aminoacyl-tRNA hydrolase [Polyangiales bacterium]
MHLVVGLGNPGPDYVGNRHNIGFRIVDALAERAGASPFKSKFNADWVRATIDGSDVVLLKPMTYMNRSGESVQAASRFFKTQVDEMLCIHDELDLLFGDVRLKNGGGIAGHNGLRSLVSQLGTPDFARLRFGIGRPPKGPVDRYVLSNFNELERASEPDLIDRSCAMVQSFLRDGIVSAMNAHHGGAPPKMR